MAKEETTKVADPEPKAGDETAAQPGPDVNKQQEVDAEPPLLDHRLMHAAERMGLSEDDLTALGDKADGVLEKFADSLDEVSARFAELGRAGMATPQTAQDYGQGRTTAPAMGAPGTEDVPFQFAAEALDDLGEEYAKPIREQVLNPVAEVVNTLRAEMQQVSAWMGEQERRRAREVVDSFFTGVAERYGDAYGLPGQRTARQERAYREAVGLADQLLQGARLSGRTMSEDQALEDAVYLHQRPGENERRVRDGKSAVQKRAKEVGTRASQRGKAPATGREARLDRYREWRRKAFG